MDEYQDRDGASAESFIQARVQVSRWISDEPFPGLVEAKLVDTDGRTHLFQDKVAVFTTEDLNGASVFPTSGELRCTEVGREGDDVILISSEMPDHVESVDGQTLFKVSMQTVDRE